MAQRNMLYFVTSPFPIDKYMYLNWDTEAEFQLYVDK